jgi:glycine/D-amino acid oxidase-like deaminating enzyme
MVFGGVIGITAAYDLARAARRSPLSIISRGPALAALETSFANTGETSPAYASGGPGVPLKAING